MTAPALQQPLTRAEEPKVRTKKCVWHCGGCGDHFSSVGAFDAHRQEMRCVSTGSARKLAGKNAGELLLRAWTTDGVCELARGCKNEGRVVAALTGVTIWQLDIDAPDFGQIGLEL